jgi:diguanylate cyclase (GGDEF)-like protein
MNGKTSAWLRFRGFVIRNRLSILDGSILVASLGVATYVAFACDLFLNEGHVTVHQETIELDESLLLGVLLAVGLLIFAWRRYVEQKREAARRRAAEEQARELSLQDSLTGLPNRRRFDEALQTAIASPPRAGASHAVFLLDLNGFKRINDVHGHGAGDRVLIEVSGRLLKAMRTGDIVARFGGDEFAILAHHLSDPEVAASIALRVIDSLKDPILIGSDSHVVGAGIGIALIPSDATDQTEALRRADIALYRAKDEGRSALRFFETGMDQRVQQRDRMIRELRAALANGEINPFFRPVFDLTRGQVASFETIPRWVHPSLGEIAPERFLAIADEAGMTHELFDQVLGKACAVVRSWPDGIGFSIDLQPVLLHDQTLARRISGMVMAAGLDPARLELEITESALVSDVELARGALAALRAEGMRIALDNFGTGYSSLYHLRTFKLDKIKIDRSFVEAMASERESASIVSALVGLGQGLGLQVAVDGLGEGSDFAALNATGCALGQGEKLGELLSPESATALIGGEPLARLQA